MSSVIRFFHIRPNSPRGGATVKVVGNLDDVGYVSIQVGRCSNKDVFEKKAGRSCAECNPAMVVPLRYLPRHLSDVANAVKADNTDFSFALKYFLSKE